MMKPKGWKGESRRHSMASKGIKSKDVINKMEGVHSKTGLYFWKTILPYLKATVILWKKRGYEINDVFIEEHYYHPFGNKQYTIVVTAINNEGKTTQRNLSQIKYESTAIEIKNEIIDWINRSEFQ